jgi:hypothetical protein
MSLFKLIFYCINIINKNHNLNHFLEPLRVVLKQRHQNHWNEMKQMNSLKEAHIYCVLNKLNGQIMGPLIEKYIKENYGMKKNNASDCLGDVVYANTNYEIKVSCGGKLFNQFNYVQIRMNHQCNYLLTAYYLCDENIDNGGELFLFRLTKDDIQQLIFKYGGYAHGTKRKLGIIQMDDLKNSENEREYALRPRIGSKCWIELQHYRVYNIIELMIC